MTQKRPKMKIMTYHCKARRQGRAKAYAGVPDQKSNALHVRGIRQLKKHSFQESVYLYSTTSEGSVY